MNRKIVLLISLIAFSLFLLGCTQESIDIKKIPASNEIKTFYSNENEICRQDGKPIIRLYSTTWCPHCKWIKQVFDDTAKDYASQGKIIAFHWELDIKDDTLTSNFEGSVPENEATIFKQFNPSGGVPAFVFGCKYIRIGNGFEKDKSNEELEKEVAEFKAVINKLLKE